jgi:AcrR family transcriptional regulator
MKLSTKERIVNSTLHLLNEEGLKNIKLQQIADHVGISVGNLAYHFSDFKQLFYVIETKTLNRLNQISDHWDASEYFIDFDNKLTQYFHLMKRFKYYFVDSIEIKRSYPKLYENRIGYANRFRKSLENLFASKQRDHFLIFENDFELSDLSYKIWIVASLWLIERELEEKVISNDLAFRKVIWNHIFPYFSEAGKIEFEIIILPKL